MLVLIIYLIGDYKNGSFYQNPTFPTIENDLTLDTIEETPVTEDDILVNKKVKLYVSFLNNCPWQNKIYECTVLKNENNYLLIKDINNIEYLIKKFNIDYIEFI